MSATTRNTRNVFPLLPYDEPLYICPKADDHSAKSQAASEEPAVLGGIKHISPIEDSGRGEDVESVFWTMYKRVSNEHDAEFLKQAHGDMAVVLTFAGLFTAVTSSFINGMQPTPVDVTNKLISLLIKVIANGPDGVNINDLPSSTTYPPSSVWMETLLYASLAFSLLAAFGAVVGKQWLNSYKRAVAPGRGSLEERGLQRQRKLDGLERWHLETILEAFLELLLISLLLFGMSLSANMFVQQHSISGVIIFITGFGFLFYLATIVISWLDPDSPFQTARFIRKNSSVSPNTLDKSSVIRWTLEKSTEPEVVEAAVAMVPRTQWPPKLDISAMYTRLVDNFATCFDSPELRVAYGKALTHLRIQLLKTRSLDLKEQIVWRYSQDMHQVIDVKMINPWKVLSDIKFT